MEPGYKYEGSYNDRYQRHGVGIATFNNGDRYEGNYENGKRGGFGVYTFANGSEYNGEWKNGKKHGIGVFTYSDKSNYDGEWCDDLRHGYGKYFYNNGDYYEGEWSSHLRHGKGKYAYAISNLLYTGTWFEGKRTGDGIVSRIGECLILTISNQKSTPDGKSGDDATPSRTGSQDGVAASGNFQYHLFHSGADFQVTTSSSLSPKKEEEKAATVTLDIIDSTTFTKSGFNYHVFHSKSPFGEYDLPKEAQTYDKHSKEEHKEDPKPIVIEAKVQEPVIENKEPEGVKDEVGGGETLNSPEVKQEEEIHKQDEASASPLENEAQHNNDAAAVAVHQDSDKQEAQHNNDAVESVAAVHQDLDKQEETIDENKEQGAVATAEGEPPKED